MFTAEDVKGANFAIRAHRIFRWVELAVAALFFSVAYSGWNSHPFHESLSEVYFNSAVLQARMTTGYFVVAVMITLKVLLNWRVNYFTKLVGEQVPLKSGTQI